METAEFIDTLRREGPLLADAAAGAGLDAEVPPCPGWRVRDLVTHTASVHRWAADYVLTGAMERKALDPAAPDDGELLDWYLRMHGRLTEALTAAPADLTCWFFLTAPSALAFWARRQAHETTMHRIDAERARGIALSPVDSAFAADGVDELLAGFHGRRRSQVRTEQPRTLRIRSTDTGHDWLVRLSAEQPVTERGADGPADCTISGRANDLYRALWNRGPYEALAVEGDGSLVELWQRTAAIG
ncbi:maleylpyruvate isomerase family mycothiol-dependent enzyme [Actinacidiphila acididurans]|uniref:Maleylpyruvate isomerase family mycothiol-dependent enzyme n=1 Tax=Actinacidiphila acididurans TaxID=2784346 RepID=A0ABS2TVS6_9ACTN|nr:maleylpyruvate isomerase family mycothiol-dependent enzyme [Actinacidiphila acididurans]MBM9507450.1 maleylpyruvate isomerase family mycothiol-dependent enzyme [Actinacidiphila acididurans]